MPRFRGRPVADITRGEVRQWFGGLHATPAAATVSLSGGTTAHEPIFFETVAAEVFRRYGRTWKPATLAVNRVYLRNQIMPRFRGRPVADITRGEVRQWFGGLHATPAAANRSLPILSVIMRQAEVYEPEPETCGQVALARSGRAEQEHVCALIEPRLSPGGKQPLPAHSALQGAAKGALSDPCRDASSGPGSGGAPRPPGRSRCPSSACCCSRAAGRARSEQCAGMTIARATSSCVTARPDPERCGSRRPRGA